MGMPRTARASVGGICYHVLNRGNAGLRVFSDEADYEGFVELLERACNFMPMRVLAYCVMPTHFHLCVWPFEDGDLGRWMQWLLTSHVRRHHRRHDTNGHIWQGRFKAFPAQSDHHLLTVLRYIERNPLQSDLVESAEEWAWSSLSALPSHTSRTFLHAGPVPRPMDWMELVDQAQSEKELKTLKRCVDRGSPFGSPAWTAQTAEELGLQAALRPRGRPRKSSEKK